jgi:dienelactone hydrolase
MAMSGLIKKDMKYRFRDLSMSGYFSVSAEGLSKRPGVLIVHDAFGLDSHCIGIADRLATKGSLLSRSISGGIAASSPILTT